MTFARKPYKRERVYPKPVPAHLRSTATLGRADGCTAAVEKENAIHHEGYRRLVAARPCMNCGINDNSQAAHPNSGKAKGAKADDRLCFPLCAVRFNAPGCHYMFDQHQLFPRSQRAGIEQRWATETREAIETAGLWPANLPRWIE